MTDFEKRLADAMAGRDREIEVDPGAWQTHLDLARAGRRSAAWGRSPSARWRAPALVAAAVIAVGLTGGIMAQTGLSGTRPVSPAAPLSSTTTGGDTDAGTGARAPVRTGAAGPTAPAAPTSGPTSALTSVPRRSGGKPGTAPGAGAGDPRSSGRSALPPPAATGMPGSTTTTRPKTTRIGTTAPDARTAGGQDGRTSSTAQSPPGAGVVSKGSAAVGRSLIDISDVVPCDRELPPLGEEVSDITVSGGPDGVVVNHAEQPVPVLAIGFAVLTGDGRVASVTGGDAALSGMTASPLPSGQSPLQDFAALRPLRLCGGPGTTAAESSVRSTSVVETYATSALPSGAYRATTVVLLGTDLDHAHAYRVGKTWRFSNR